MSAPVPFADALLLDVDGTLHVGDTPIPGAPPAVRELERRGFALRYLTNTTRFSRRALAARLRAMDFPASDDQLFTAPVAAAAWLRARKLGRIALYVPDSTRADFTGFTLSDDAPEAVVVGDLGAAWDFATLDRAFRQLLGGARLVALQKNRYWRTSEGLSLDAGAFVAALEYAANVTATVVGKPSPEFFRLAAASLPPGASAPVVVGDDPATDLAGADAAGIPAIVVRTGKFRESELDACAARPLAVLESIAELPTLVARLRGG